jgi:dihydrofolate reductase
VKVVLYVASTVDRFIADENGNSDWVLDEELFTTTVQEFGVIAVGRTTFDQFSDTYPLNGVQHLVLTKKKGQKSPHKGVHYVNTPAQALKKAEELGFKQLLVIGGGKTNGSFVGAGVVNELWVDLHPSALGKGVKMFGDFVGNIELELISQTPQPQGFLHCQFKLTVSKKKAKKKPSKKSSINNL